MMKNQKFLLLCLAFFLTNASFLQASNNSTDYNNTNESVLASSANGQYDVRAVADCSNLGSDIYRVNIQLRAKNSTTTFHVSDQNYRFSFTRDAISNPTPTPGVGLIGMIGTPGNYSLYNHTTTGSIDTIVSFNITLDGGPGQLIGTSWFTVGQVKFDVDDPCAAVDIKLHDKLPENFPPTFVGERYNDVLYAATDNLYFFENDAACPTGPVGEYDVKLEGCINSTGDKYTADVLLRATSAATIFNVSDQNYRFSFDRGSVENPTHVSGSGLDGPAGMGNYGYITTTGSIDTIVSYNIVLGTNAPGITISNTGWTLVGQVEFDVLDASIPVNFKLHDKAPENFPPTFIGETYCNVLSVANEGDYFEEDLGTCPTAFAGGDQTSSLQTSNNSTDDNDINKSILSSSTANGQYDVRAVADCSNAGSDIYRVNIQLRAKNSTTTFHVSDQNYRFSFTRDAISNPTPTPGVGLIGVVGTPGNYSLYNHTTTGSIDTIVSFNITLDGGPGQLIGTSWFTVGQVKFDVEEPCTAVEIKLHDKLPENFPPTFVGEKFNNVLYAATDNLYFFENDAACQEGCNTSLTSGDQTSSFQGNTDIASTLNKATMKTFPNPASSNLTVELNLATTTDSKLTVTDFTGRTIARQVITAQNGQQQININVADYKAGFYFITLETDTERVTKKVVVVK